METPGVSYHIQQKTERGRQVDINKMKPTTSAVLSDNIALSEGDHPDTSAIVRFGCKQEGSPKHQSLDCGVC